jgi:hypothetical protein
MVTLALARVSSLQSRKRMLTRCRRSKTMRRCHVVEMLVCRLVAEEHVVGLFSSELSPAQRDAVCMYDDDDVCASVTQ